MAGWESAGVRLTAPEEGELAAARLAQWLKDGHALPDVQPSLPNMAWLNLDAGEGCKYQTDARSYVYCGADVEYNRGLLLVGGSTKMVAGSLAASALYNRRQRRKAQAQAAAQWRPISECTLFFTSARMIVAAAQWNSLYYHDFDYVSHDVMFGVGPGLRMGVGGSDPIFFAVGWQSLWLFVLLMYLARGEVPHIPHSRELAEKMMHAHHTGVPLVSPSGQKLELPPLTET